MAEAMEALKEERAHPPGMLLPPGHDVDGRCERFGCGELAKLMCSRCKSSLYCSTKCQSTCW